MKETRPRFFPSSSLLPRASFFRLPVSATMSLQDYSSYDIEVPKPGFTERVASPPGSFILGAAVALIIALFFRMFPGRKAALSAIFAAGAVTLVNVVASLLLQVAISHAISYAVTVATASFLASARILETPTSSSSSSPDHGKLIETHYHRIWLGQPAASGQYDVNKASEHYKIATAAVQALAAQISALEMQFAPLPAGNATRISLEAQVSILKPQYERAQQIMINLKEVYATILSAYENAQHKSVFALKSSINDFAALTTGPAAASNQAAMRKTYGELTFAEIMQAVRGTPSAPAPSSSSNAMPTIRYRSGSTPRA